MEVFIRETIRNMGLTNKAYGGLRLLIIGIFKYAKRQKYSEISITQFFGDLELPKKCFVKKAVKDDESVFTDDEVEKISNYIQGNKLCIRRTEVRYRDKDGNYVFEVRESPKTEAGNRDIILNSEAKRTLKEIRKMNPFGE